MEKPNDGQEQRHQHRQIRNDRLSGSIETAQVLGLNTVAQVVGETTGVLVASQSGGFSGWRALNGHMDWGTMVNVVGVLTELVQVNLHRVAVNVAAIHVSGGHIGTRPFLAGPADGQRAVAMALDAKTSLSIVDASEKVVRMQAVEIDAHRLNKVVLLVSANVVSLPVGTATRIHDSSGNYKETHGY